MSPTSGLTVRQYERAGIELPIEFVVCDAHSAQVQFSSSSSAVTPQTIRGRAMDISSGGMGLEMAQFVPRMCEGIVRVLDPALLLPDAARDAAVAALFEHPVKVRRVYLTGREPRYALGVAFIDPPADIDTRIGALLAQFGSNDQGAAHA